MAEAIGFAIVEAAATTGAAEGLVAFAEGSFLGISGATAIGSAAILGATIGLQYALSKPNTPKAEDGSQALKQSIPPRQMGYGTNRLAGSYLLFESQGSAPATSYDVIAFHSGRIGGIASIYFHDDLVTPDGDINDGGVHNISATFSDERYSLSRIKVEARLGTNTQTALAVLTSDSLINSLWTSAHRGRGIAMLAVVSGGLNDPSDFTRIYPRGRPEPSVVADCAPVCDRRDPDQDPDDETTWQVSYNPIINLMDFLTRADGGMGHDFDKRILPNLALWLAEADVCDALVAKADGSFEPRYACSTWFQFDNAPENIMGAILASCDGWFSESGDGTFLIKVGLYSAPTLPPLTEEHIFSFSLDYGTTNEDLVNQLDISFTDPAQAYVSNQTESWRDEDSISLIGEVKPKPLDLKSVQSASQARRLADRAMKRVNPLMSGSFSTKLYGLRYLGERWVAIQYPFVSGLQDSVVEIQSAKVNWKRGSISWSFILVLPEEIESYDPDNDEGTAPVVPPPGSSFALLREDGAQYVREDDSFYARENA